MSGPTALNIYTPSLHDALPISNVGTGQVQYGLTTSYGKLTTPESSFTYSSHIQPISGLASGTTYHYRVVSKNSSGGQVTSGDSTFTTLATATTSPPPSSDPATTNTVRPIW